MQPPCHGGSSGQYYCQAVPAPELMVLDTVRALALLGLEGVPHPVAYSPYTDPNYQSGTKSPTG